MRRRKGKTCVTTDDHWHIGSVGKSLTATLIAKLFEEEVPKLDCSIVDLLPEIDMHESWRDCTLYHLLTSTSGLPANFPLATLKIREDDPEKLTNLRRVWISKALSKPPKFQSGSRFLYSNLGYTVLGYIAEKRARQPFIEVLEKEVINPIGLQGAGFGAPMGANEDDEPMGHRVLLGFRVMVNPFKSEGDNPPIIAPAGRVHMTIEHLLRYGRSHLAGHFHQNALLKSETWDLLHRPYLNDYACGWVSKDTDRGNGEMIWHNGSNGFWYTLLIIVPSKDIVLAFVSNDGAIKVAERTFFETAQKLLNEIDC